MNQTFSVVAAFALLIPYSNDARSQESDVKRVSIDNQLVLHYVEKGTGEPVVFINHEIVGG